MSTTEDGNQSPGQSRTVTTNIISGTVKWFNVRSGYGFIKRDDNAEDIFVHQTAIIKNNPKKYLRSVGDGETVEFIVIQGAKGPEAAQVTGPNGSHVEGSKYAPERRPRYPRRRQGGQRKTIQTSGQDSQGEERGVSDAEDSPKQEQPARRRPRRSNYRGGQTQYYRGGYRGRGPPREPRDGPPREREPREPRDAPPREREPRDGPPRDNDYRRRRRRGPPREDRGEREGDFGRGEGQRGGEYNESRVYRPRGGPRRGRRPRGPRNNPPNENNASGEDEEPQQQHQQEGGDSPKQ